MTNCPNCGAPYALNSRVCEYCGTVCEKSSDEIRMEQELEQARVNVEQARQEFLMLRLQAAQKAQCDNITFNLGNGNAIVNSKIGVNNRVAVNAGSGTMVFMGDVNGVKDISVTHSGCGVDVEYKALEQSIMSKYRFMCMICLSILTLFLPTMSVVCSTLVSRSTSIVGKILGGFLLPLWYSLSYVIVLRGLKRHDGAR